LEVVELRSGSRISGSRREGRKVAMRLTG
jgi:hypothetical protein